KYNFFSIPVLAKIGLGKKWDIVAGPQFDWIIQGTETSDDGKIDVTNYLKDFDILATGGIEFWASKSIVFCARYMRGFNDIDFRSNLTRYYSEGVQITFGVKLNGTKKPKPPTPVTVVPEVQTPKDSDGDGIMDDKDKCPNVPGVAKYDGCPVPDTDG